MDKKRDPLTIKPHSKSTTKFAEDRAKLVKSKKFGSLMAAATVKKRRLLPLSEDILPSSSKRRNVKELTMTKAKKQLMIRIGPKVMVKKTTKLGQTHQWSEVALKKKPQRRCTRFVNYAETDCIIETEDGEPLKNKKFVLPKNKLIEEISAKGNDRVKERKLTKQSIEFKESVSTREQKAIDKIVEEITEKREVSKVGKSRKQRVRLNRQTGDDDNDKGSLYYTCAHCLRTFLRKSNLKRHMIKLHFDKQEDEEAKTGKWFTGYCCDVCGEGLQVRTTMLAHREVVHSDVPEIDWCKYQTSLGRVKFCVGCRKYFRVGKSYEEHECDMGESLLDEDKIKQIKEAEEIKPCYSCDVCSLCFRWKWDYRLHRETDHKQHSPIDWTLLEKSSLDFICDQCLKAFRDERELVNHSCNSGTQKLQAGATVKPFTCELCGNGYFWKSDFRRHMRTKHPKENHKPTEHDTIIYKCPYCTEEYSMKKSILQHIRKEHNVNTDSPFVCVKCNKVFRRRDNLDRHNESYHPNLPDEEEKNAILKKAEIRINGDLVYHCQTCNRNMADSNRYISHYRGHNSETKYTCDLCGKQTRTQHQLNTHIKNTHLNIRNYKCDLCTKCFYTKQACDEHRRIHTGERPFACEICGKTFVAGNALISHKRFHNDFYPHPCHMCPKKFKVRRSLINHVRTHTGERPYKCDVCTKTFNNSSQYSYHKKVTHSDARPFSCSLCGNRFKANKFLSRHMELHNMRSRIQIRRPNKGAYKGDVSNDEQSILCTPTIQNYVKEPESYPGNEDVASMYNIHRPYGPTSYPPEFQGKGTLTSADAYVSAASFVMAGAGEYKALEGSRTFAGNSTTAPASAPLHENISWM